MNKVISLLLIFVFFVIESQSRSRVVKPKASSIRKIANSEHGLAKLNFISFLNCSLVENMGTKWNQKKLHGCMKRFLVKSSYSQLIKYEFLYQKELKISEPFLCSIEKEKWIRHQEDSSWGPILCFEYDYGSPEIGYVFFEKSSGKYLIGKIKI